MFFKKSTIVTSLIILLIVTFVACEKIMPSAPNADDVMDAPIDGLTSQQHKLFLEGAEEFDEVYTTETGLGPIFVATSCVSCHAGNNKGHPFTTLTRFGQSDTTGNKFIQFGAPQLQQYGIAGYLGENIPAGASFTKLIAPIVSGNGFLELVTDQNLLAMADPNDQDGDSISGRVNWNSIPEWVIPSPNAITQNGKYICRFGKKAGTYNLHQQTAIAFNQDIGITTTFMPNNPFNYITGLNPVTTNDPDISDQSVNATVFYLQTLQAPIRRNQTDEDVIKGKQIFNQVACNACHKETLTTGFSPIQSLSFKDFHAYTDLLLHDMGNELDDNYTEGGAQTNEWRTAPLWGMGLSPAVQAGQYFLMHDGRATSIEEAILMHGGEASNSKNKYEKLSESDKTSLINFLESL